MSPQVSIIVPIYNVALFLDQCLASLAKQTLSNLEIICVNDGSTDNSAQIVQKYLETDPRFQLINQSNQGLGAARNSGLKAATGEYVGFVDSDDWVEAEMYADLYQLASAHDVDLVICGMKVFDESKNSFTNNNYYSFSQLTIPLHQPYQPVDYLNNLFQIPVSACNKIFRRQKIIDLQLSFPTQTIFEDNPFFYTFYLNAHRSMIIDQPYYCRRVRSGSITTTSSNSSYVDIFPIFRKLSDTFCQSPFWPQINASFLQHQIGVALGWLKKTSPQFKPAFYHAMHQYFLALDLSLYQTSSISKTKEYALFQLLLRTPNYQQFQLQRSFLPAVIKYKIGQLFKK